MLVFVLYFNENIGSVANNKITIQWNLSRVYCNFVSKRDLSGETPLHIIWCQQVDLN